MKEIDDLIQAIREEQSSSYESCAWTNNMGYIDGLAWALIKVRELGLSSNEADNIKR